MMDKEIESPEQASNSAEDAPATPERKGPNIDFEKLAREQGVDTTNQFETINELIKNGEPLWANDAEFDAWMAGMAARRRGDYSNDPDVQR